MNEDYKKGIKFLTRKCREAGIEIRKYPWIADLSKILSDYNACHIFWFNCSFQNRLDRIMSCCVISDILYGSSALFIWNNTAEGEGFWRGLLAFKLFDGYEDYTLDKINLVR